MNIKWTFISELTNPGMIISFPWDAYLSELSKSLENITFELVQLKGSEAFVEGVLMKPKDSNGKKLPLIVFPHGGPHSAFTTDYTHFVSLTQLGAGVLMGIYF